jgi:hypothetical protein
MSFNDSVSSVCVLQSFDCDGKTIISGKQGVVWKRRPWAISGSCPTILQKGYYNRFPGHNSKLGPPKSTSFASTLILRVSSDNSRGYGSGLGNAKFKFDSKSDKFSPCCYDGIGAAIDKNPGNLIALHF